MLKSVLAAAAVATVGFAAPAFAQDSTGDASTTVFHINATNPAKCQVNADQTTVTLADDAISNDQGRARANVGQQIARQLNGLNAHAWCTGTRNALVLTRSPLTTGNGEQNGGFNQAVIYDVAVDIADAMRVDNEKPIEGTSDGAGNGPGAGVGSATPIGHFGPTGQGSKLNFSNEQGSTSEATTNAAPDQSRDQYTSSNARLVAGEYTGTVTLTLTPHA